MVIDTSALIAILLNESDGLTIRAAMRKGASPGDRFIAMPTLLEASIVMYGRKREQGVSDLDKLCDGMAITPQPFHSNHLKIARDAYTRYGKASGHPAKLNFGDCFSYALAKQRGDALLCKGDDFSKTDIRLVAY